MSFLYVPALTSGCAKVTMYRDAINPSPSEFTVVPDPLAVTGIFFLGASAGALVTYARLQSALGECRRALAMVDSSSEPPQERAPLDLGMKAFIVGKDAEMISLFSTLLREKGIRVENCFRESAAVEQLSQKKFEVLVLDFDHAPECAYILKCLPNPNQQATVIAVASSANDMEHAAGLGASLVIGRPMDPLTIREFLGLAYGRMLRDRQSYFRLAVQLPVSIRKASGAVLSCTTLNVSQTGIAVTTPSNFNIGEAVRIKFDVPNTNVTLCAEGNVIWDDKHGEAGIRFHSSDAAIQTRYFEWLHDRFYTTRERERSASEAPEEVVYAG